MISQVSLQAWNRKEAQTKRICKFKLAVQREQSVEITCQKEFIASEQSLHLYLTRDVRRIGESNPGAKFQPIEEFSIMI